MGITDFGAQKLKVDNTSEIGIDYRVQIKS